MSNADFATYLLKIKEAFMEQTDFAWYSSEIGDMEFVVDSVKNTSYNNVESYLLSYICDNDFFILEALRRLSFGSVGNIHRMMNELKRSGYSVVPVDIEGLSARLDVFERIGLVYRYSFVDPHRKRHQVYSLTNISIRIVRKYLRVDLLNFDKTYLEANRVDRMRHLAAAVCAVTFAKNLSFTVNIDSCGRMFYKGCDMNEFYFTRLQAFKDKLRKDFYFEPVFLREFTLITEKESRDYLLRRLGVYSRFFEHEVSKDESFVVEPYVVLVVEDKTMLNTVVEFLAEHNSEYLDKVLFTSTNVVRKVSAYVCPFLYVISDTVSKIDGVLTYKSGLLYENGLFDVK